MIILQCPAYNNYYALPFCKLNDSQKHRGGAYTYMRDLTFYLVKMPPLPVPRLDVDIGRLLQTDRNSSTPVCLHFSRPPETQIPFGQDRLTEVGHSVDVSKHFSGFSFQCAIALTPFTNVLAINSEFLSCSADAGFILALPLHHRDLETCQYEL